MRLQRDNRSKADQLAQLKQELGEIREDEEELKEKLRKANEIIQALRDDNTSYRDEIDHLRNATMNLVDYGHEITSLQRQNRDLDAQLSSVER